MFKKLIELNQIQCSILMQIFEWCHYMITSKNPQTSGVICGMGSKGTLNSSYTNQLSEHYKKCIPVYSKILSEYEEESRRATTKRKKNQFPDKCSWNPMGKVLTSDERILLVGPLNELTFYKSLSITDSTTKRVIQYSVESMQARCNSSFVYVKDSSEESSQPQFGCIFSLFTHFFTELQYWAILDCFAPASYNTECSMWHVPAEPFLRRTIIPLDHLSYPLVVACENKQNWFLNFSS